MKKGQDLVITSNRNKHYINFCRYSMQVTKKQGQKLSLRKQVKVVIRSIGVKVKNLETSP